MRRLRKPPLTVTSGTILFRIHRIETLAASITEECITIANQLAMLHSPPPDPYAAMRQRCQPYSKAADDAAPWQSIPIPPRRPRSEAGKRVSEEGARAPRKNPGRNSPRR